MPLPRRLTGIAGPALLVVTAALLGGCAQPDQLGHESQPGGTGSAQAPGTATAAPEQPAITAVPGVTPGSPLPQSGSDAQGTVDQPVEISTRGPAELLVRTEVLQPGQSTGWIRHPGTALTAIRSGTVIVQRAGSCEPAGFGPGQAFSLGDGEPNLLRNDGAEPVVLTRSELLAPGSPEREPTAPAC